jgi:spectinomycin phosphotransferase
VGARIHIQEELVLQALRESYDLPLERLAFLTTGWVSYCYKAEIAAGAAYLVKLYDADEPTPFVAGSRDFYLPLTHQLCARRLLPQIACPVPARDGRFVVRAGPYLLIVFDFIDGERVGFGRLPDAVLAQLATLVGRLHRATRALDLVDPLTEHFAIAFEQALPAQLAALAGPAPDGGAFWHGLQELLIPQRDAILGHLSRLKELQAVVRARHGELVVCHTDLHGGNLLVNGQGDLFIIDWENAMLAPPEHDLFMYAEDERFWDLFWPAYQREFGPARLDVDTLGFYCYRRGLEDLADWFRLLFSGGRGHQHDSHELRSIAGTMTTMANLEATLRRIAVSASPKEAHA